MEDRERSARSAGPPTPPGVAATVDFAALTPLSICIFRDGKFVEVWNEVDFLKMYAQLGALSLDLK